MPLVNLIQERRIEAEANEQKTRIFFLTFVGSASLALLSVGYLTFKVESLGSEEARLKLRATRVLPVVRDIEAKTKQYDVVLPKVQTLEDAQKMTGRWGRILTHLAHQTPPETWLTNMRCTVTDPTKPILVTFVGVSQRQELIGEFLLRLQGTPDLQNVALHYTSEKSVSNGHNLEFEVAADVAGTADEKKALLKEEGK